MKTNSVKPLFMLYRKYNLAFQLNKIESCNININQIPWIACFICDTLVFNDLKSLQFVHHFHSWFILYDSSILWNVNFIIKDLHKLDRKLQQND